MELKEIMKYQETDIKLRKLMDMLERSEDSKRMEQAKQEFNAARSQILECEKEAERLMEAYADFERFYSESASKLEELELVIENAEDDEMVVQLIAETERIRSRIIEGERKVFEIKQRAEKVMRDYKESGERGKKMRDIHNAAKERQDVLRKEKEPQINEIKAVLAAMEANIDGDLLEKYKSITSQGKYPAIVEVYEDGSTFSCRGCGLALSQKNKSELVEKGLCRCETCRRMLYRKSL